MTDPSPPAPHAWAVLRTVPRIALAGGVALGVLGQVLVAVLNPHMAHATPWPRHRVLGLLVVAGLYAAVGLIGGAISSLLARRYPRLGAAVAATWLTTWFALAIAGIVVRLLSGGFATWGAVAFCLSSHEHFLHAGLSGYARYTLPLVVGAIAFAWLLGRWLLRGASQIAPHRAKRELSALVAGSFAIAVISAAAPVDATTRRLVAQTSAELAMVDSLSSLPFARGTASPAVQRAATEALESAPPLIAAQLQKPVAGPRPNVLLLTLESIDQDHFSHRGYNRPTTPYLDRIAANSLRFERAWTTATHSNYAQMAILSSLFPRRGQTLDMYTRLDYPRFLLHDFTHGLGYATATISSQDETWQGMLRFQSTPTPTYYRHAGTYDGPKVDTGTELVIPDHITAARAIEWIDAQDAPWQLYVNFQATHFPYKLEPDVARPYLPESPRGHFAYVGYGRSDLPRVHNRYDNALTYVDEQVGKLTSHLERTGQLDNTILIITADHGEMFFDHELVTHGRSLYDAEARVPLWFHFPAKLAPAERTAPASHIDILPTLSALLGQPPHPSFQGRNLLDAAETAPSPIYLNTQGWTHARALVCWPYKLIVSESGPDQLFDLARDAEEGNDLAAAHPKISTAMKTQLSAFMLAQERYHSTETSHRYQSFAPRPLPCPLVTDRAETAQKDAPLDGASDTR